MYYCIEIVISDLIPLLFVEGEYFCPHGHELNNYFRLNSWKLGTVIGNKFNLDIHLQTQLYLCLIINLGGANFALNLTVRGSIPGSTMHSHSSKQKFDVLFRNLVDGLVKGHAKPPSFRLTRLVCDQVLGTKNIIVLITTDR